LWFTVISDGVKAQSSFIYLNKKKSVGGGGGWVY